MASSLSPGQQTTPPPSPPPDYAPAESPVPEPTSAAADDKGGPRAATSPVFVFVGEPNPSATGRAIKSGTDAAEDDALSSVALGSPPAASLESVPAPSVDSVPGLSLDSAPAHLVDFAAAESVDFLPAASLDCDPAVTTSCNRVDIKDSGSTEEKNDFLSSCLCLFECKFGICKLIQYCKCFRK